MTGCCQPPVPDPPTQAQRGYGEPLTPRELSILPYLGGRLTEREIGAELFLSRNTIHTHVASILRKLGVSSRGEAFRVAMRLPLKLVHDDDVSCPLCGSQHRLRGGKTR